jgi:hypothetical protein
MEIGGTNSCFGNEAGMMHFGGRRGQRGLLTLKKGTCGYVNMMFGLMLRIQAHLASWHLDIPSILRKSAVDCLTFNQRDLLCMDPSYVEYPASHQLFL